MSPAERGIYTEPMTRRNLSVLLTATSIVAAAVWASTGGMQLTLPDGEPLSWDEFVAREGPLVVLVWASWAPEAQKSLERGEPLRRAAEELGYRFVIVDVQEPMRQAQRALGEGDLPWLHDRHGELLKRYRVLRLPRLLVVDENGELRYRMPVRVGVLESLQ